MNIFLLTLQNKNKLLYYFGWCNLAGALLCIVMWLFTDTVVLGINSWIKPLKFFLSTIIFSWSMGWYLPDLRMPKVSLVYSWIVIIVLSFENIYIVIQAAKGELSHFNGTDHFHGLMFTLMGVMIGILTVWTFIIGVLFFIRRMPNLPSAYKWGIRIGIMTFVAFAMVGGLMAANLSHTVGAPDGGEGLVLLNWSTQFGDLRVAHFLGMHALQVFPLAGYYLFRQKTSYQVVFMLIYIGSCVFVLWQALSGIPLLTI
ncbi:MAG: hypothetical protein WBA74_22230 [Cyclobacteriaceae bacterium]